MGCEKSKTRKKLRNSCPFPIPNSPFPKSGGFFATTQIGLLYEYGAVWRGSENPVLEVVGKIKLNSN
jgi:hypothetical protein